MTRPDDRRWIVATLLALVAGLFLLQGPIRANSATYDEVTYLEVAATWWRTGAQDSITRMGSPLTFWKLQQAPGLQCIDDSSTRIWLDYPLLYPESLLPPIRTCACWLWGVGFWATIRWARRRYGPRAMASAAWLYAVSPNLLAHGALITMEMPLVAASAAMFFAFASFLDVGHRRLFFLSAVMAGVAFSCKFTAVLFPPILGACWFVERIAHGDRRWFRLAFRLLGGMIVFGLVMVLANLILTGFATIPLSERVGDHPTVNGHFGPTLDRLASRMLETPWPQDWVGFARQMSHQRGGGSSYLFGERRMHGWWYYYFVCLAVKVPLTVGLMLGMRLFLLLRRPSPGLEADRTNPFRWHADERLIAVTVVLFLLVVSVASSRNYGVRYLLPLAPLGIVWCSGLAESGQLGRMVLLAGLAGQAAAVTTIHPYELSYFNPLAGGKIGGRHILADSNLDWGQGLVQLVKWQRKDVQHEDLTTYYFGNINPYCYRLIGKTFVIDARDDHPGLPARFTAATRYVAVSASLQYGPWGPEGYFDRLSHVKPIAFTADGTIAIYRTADVFPNL